MNTEITYDLVFSYGLEVLINIKANSFKFKEFADELYKVLGENDYIKKDVKYREANFPGLIGLDIDNEIKLEKYVNLIMTDFITLGIIIPFYQDLTKCSYTFSSFGKEIIENNQFHIYDKDGYLKNLKTQIPELDETIEVYFDDALSTFKTNNYRASIILLGGASERLIHILKDTIISDSENQNINKLLKSWEISKVFEGICKYIESLDTKNGELSYNLKEKFKTNIKTVFETIKTTRNEAVHPGTTKKIIYREDAKRYLLLFPDYCEHVYKLIDYFNSSK